MMDKYNAFRLLNIMEAECLELEKAIQIKDNSKIKLKKEVLLSLQKQMQDEIDRA